MPAIIDENTQYIDPDTSAPILNGKVFYGAQGSDPEAVPIEVFSDRAMTPVNVVPQPVRTDASGRTIPSPLFVAGRYSFIVKTSGDSQKLISLDAGQEPITGIVSLTNIRGTGNAIIADADPPIGAPVNGQQFTLTAASINTDKMTIAVDTSGPKPLKFNFNEEMAPGFVQAGATLNFTYNSTEDAYFWINEGRGISLLTGVAGDGNAITAIGGPSTTGLVNGQRYQFTPNVTNTGPVKLTVKPDGIASFPELSIKSQGNELSPGQLVVGKPVEVVFNSTPSPDEFELVSGAPFSGVLRTALDTNGFPINTSRSTVASAATSANIWTSPGGNEVDFTGTATVTTFPDAPRAGASRILHCADACTFTNNANLAVMGAETFNAVAGDVVHVHAITTSTFRLTILKADGKSVIVIPVAFAEQLLHVEDQKSPGSDGGTFTAGSFQFRTLNTVVTNEITGAILSSNQITLPTGTYFIDASAPAFAVNGHKIKLQNTTGTSVQIIGTVELSGSTDTVQTRSSLTGRFTLTVTTIIQLQHICQTTRAANGFGNSSGSLGGTIEVFAVVKIWKVS